MKRKREKSSGRDKKGRRKLRKWYERKNIGERKMVRKNEKKKEFGREEEGKWENGMKENKT